MLSLLLMFICLAPLQERTTSLTVLSDPAGAVVLLDGRHAGTTPVTINLDGGGRHKVSLKKAGNDELVAVVELGTGEEKEIAFEFDSPNGISPVSGISNEDWNRYRSRRRLSSGLIKTGGYMALAGVATLGIAVAIGRSENYSYFSSEGEFVLGMAIVGMGLSVAGGGMAIVGAVIRPSIPQATLASDLIREIRAPELATGFDYKNLAGPKFQKLFSFRW